MERLVATLTEGVDEDLIRFRDRPEDRSIVDGPRWFLAALDDEREQWWTEREPVEHELVVMANRATVRAWRLHRQDAAIDAMRFGILTLGLDNDRTDPLRFAVVLCTLLGADIEGVLDEFQEPLELEEWNLLCDAVESARRVEDPSDLGRYWVTTHYGLGMVQVPAALLGSSAPGNVPATYAPTSDLASLAVGGADAIDQGSHYSTTPIHFTELPASYFDQVAMGGMVRTTGALGFDLANADGDLVATCIVAEIGDDGDAGWYQQTAREIDPDAVEMVAVADGARLVFLAVVPTFSDDDWYDHEDVEFVDEDAESGDDVSDRGPFAALASVFEEQLRTHR